ncbi:DUF4132 domain-containing protein [Candidatus Laterigemmans baculatus]|uniref:DUF4132 domain-containing protein n=1 Tax=Candidatus Laterigemmans baculatus TaxID=2770505 RepID=UPI0013D94F2A|nr:DUF4132 domain-containing protein [Candidatus Laterigemmans baculatus]
MVVSGEKDARSAASPADAICWLDAPRDYQIALHQGRLVCRNPKGKQLGSLPKWLKEDPLADQLQALASWLDERALECMHTVERWMLRSLVVPREALQAVWPDQDWRHAFENTVIAPANVSGKVDLERAGLLRESDSKRGLGIVDVDGESRWLTSPAVAIPHPILLQDLDDLRELAGDLNITQKIEQLYRPVYHPTKSQMPLRAIKEYEGGVFEQLNFALGACRRLGYPVRGGYATCRIWEGEEPLEARYYVGGEYPESETETGELIFVDASQRAVTVKDVGPVTFSEGVRMASAIYAKRKVEKQEEDAA